MAVGNPVDKLEQQYDDFVNLRVDQSDSTRFLSGGGYRYDYWRVAWLEFKDAPLRGQGAGNYDDLYFIERRTSEDIRQPHSLPLQVSRRARPRGDAAFSASSSAPRWPGCGDSRAERASSPSGESWPWPRAVRSWPGLLTRASTGCTTSRA